MKQETILHELSRNCNKLTHGICTTLHCYKNAQECNSTDKFTCAYLEAHDVLKYYWERYKAND